MFWDETLHLEEKVMIVIITSQLKLLLNQVGFKNAFCPLRKNIRDSLVVLIEQDIPTNYEEAMVDLSTRND